MALPPGPPLCLATALVRCGAVAVGAVPDLPAAAAAAPATRLPAAPQRLAACRMLRASPRFVVTLLLPRLILPLPLRDYLRCWLVLLDGLLCLPAVRWTLDAVITRTLPACCCPNALCLPYLCPALPRLPPPPPFVAPRLRRPALLPPRSCVTGMGTLTLGDRDLTQRLPPYALPPATRTPAAAAAGRNGLPDLVLPPLPPCLPAALLVGLNLPASWLVG